MHTVCKGVATMEVLEVVVYHGDMECNQHCLVRSEFGRNPPLCV